MTMGNFKITSPYGAEESFREGAHTGIDLAMKVGTKLRSVVDGKVVAVFDGNENIGKGVKILGRDGREYIYGHMDKVSVSIGEFVQVNSDIGLSGNTGNSTGAHLHFAVKENGEYTDPTNMKPMLDSLSGAVVPDELAFYDIGGRIELGFNDAMDNMKQEFMDGLIEVGDALLEATLGLSYSVALLGGGLLIMLRAMGMTRATKYFNVIQMVNIFIKALLGGLAQ